MPLDSQADCLYPFDAAVNLAGVVCQVLRPLYATARVMAAAPAVEVVLADVAPQVAPHRGQLVAGSDGGDHGLSQGYLVYRDRWGGEGRAWRTRTALTERTRASANLFAYWPGQGHQRQRVAWQNDEKGGMRC